MYLRSKTNRSGTTTVVVVEKKDGKQVYVKSIGTSSDPKEIARLTGQGERFIDEERRKRFPELDFDGARERAAEAELLFSALGHPSFLMLPAPTRYDKPAQL